MSSPDTRRFLPQTAIHLHLVLRMFSWAGTAKQVPLYALAAGSGPNPVPCFPNRNEGVIQLNFGARAAVARRSPPAQRGHSKPGKGKRQTRLLSTWTGATGRLKSKLLFAVLREKGRLRYYSHSWIPQAHFCGVKSYFPVLRMLHFSLVAV